MGREVRMVPHGWQHPVEFYKDMRGDTQIRFVPLLKWSYEERAKEWDEEAEMWERGMTRCYPDGWKPKSGSAMECKSYEDWAGPRPKPEDYMPDFPEGTATLYVMYEDTTEGTPISPPFATPEELARWLADNNAYAFGNRTATYEQWLAVCKIGFAPSAVIQGGVMKSGVEFVGERVR